MLKNVRPVLMVAMSLSMTLVLVSCGGVGAAPFNGGSLARVAVSVSPSSMNVTTGTTQAFTATVINTSRTTVGWLVNGFPGGVSPLDGSTPFGTIDKNGNFTAPPFIPTPPTVTVTAVATADNSATANASVSINGTPSPVTISPTSARVQVGGSTLFTGTAGPGQSANWLVENILDGNSVVGTVTPVPGSRDEELYTAPLVVPGGAQSAQVHVTVQSVANPLQTASAVVTISAASVGGVVVTITKPLSPPTVQAGLTEPFQASVTGASDTTVSWQVDSIPGGNASVGTIATASGDSAVYTAPDQIPDPPTVTVTAVSNAQPSAHASLQVNLIPAQKTIVTLNQSDPPCANPDAVPVTTQFSFTATVQGPQNEEVTWQVNKITGGNATVGTITQVGTTNTAVYTAPASVPAPATVTVGAVSVANPTASATMPLTISTTAMPRVVISPTSATVTATEAGQDFTATVQGLGDSAVADNWAVNGEVGGDSTIGTVGETVNQPPIACQAFGTYNPPAIVPNPNQVLVTAATADGLTSPGAVVTINPPPQIAESLMPGQHDEQTVQVGTTHNKVLYTDSQTKLENGQPVVDTTDPVNWTLTSQGQDCSVSNGSICGTLTPTGIVNQQFTATYTAPNAVPPVPKVTVTVTSAVQPSAFDFNDVLITNAPPTITINGPTTVQAGAGPFPYTVIITGASQDTPVVWQLGCISDWDGVSQDGNCEPTKQDDFKDGPGCIMYGRAKVCGAAGALTVPGQSALSYTPPLSVSTTDYLQNVCTLNGDPKASIVPMNASMEVNGCPQGVCTTFACVTVTP
jgi:hypothetical protein